MSNTSAWNQPLFIWLYVWIGGRWSHLEHPAKLHFCRESTTVCLVILVNVMGWWQVVLVRISSETTTDLTLFVNTKLNQQFY